jgi:hypothetical protein
MVNHKILIATLLFFFSITGFAQEKTVKKISLPADEDALGEAWPCPSCFSNPAPTKNGKPTMNPYGGMGGGLGWPTGGYPGGGMGMDDGKKSTTSQMNNTLSSIVEKIPSMMMSTEEKGAFKEYLELLGGDKYMGDGSVGGSNSGLNAYFSSIWGAQGGGGFGGMMGFGMPFPNSKNGPQSEKPTNLNQCFRDKALNFYRDISLYLKKGEKDKNPQDGQSRCDEFSKEVTKKTGSLLDYGCSGQRPDLFSKAGEKDKAQLEPGWVWKLALKHTNGNAHAAMHLIGMCGHDDTTAQSPLGYFDESEAARNELRAEMTELVDKKKKLEKEVKAAVTSMDQDPKTFMTKSKSFSSVVSQIERLQHQNGKYRSLPCPPQDSDFYLPGGLGSEADISPELKSKINKVQNPDGKSKIPAKYYHVYGSAFMACHLISNGFDPNKTVTVQKQAARFYRGVRVCSTSNELLKQHEQLENPIGRDAKKSGKSIEEYIAGQLSLFTKGEGCEKVDKEKQKSCETILIMFGDSVYGMQEDQGMAKRKIANRMARIDASYLYNSWYLGGGEVFGKKIPCTDVRLSGPKDLLNANNSLLSWFQRPGGWSKERYDAAAKHLATWDADFEWTIAQHEAGAKFAAKQCKKGKPGENPFQNMCSPSQGDSGSSPAQSESTKGVR